MSAEYQSVMSIGLNKVMNGNCKPLARTSVSSLPPLRALSDPSTDFEHAPSRRPCLCSRLPFHRLSSPPLILSLSLPADGPRTARELSVLNRLIGFSRGIGVRNHQRKINRTLPPSLIPSESVAAGRDRARKRFADETDAWKRTGRKAETLDCPQRKKEKGEMLKL